MLLEIELAWVFLKRRKGLLLRGTALAAFFGIALATMALVITVSLMEGYSESISMALQRGNAHIVGFSPGGMNLKEAQVLSGKFSVMDNVRRATPVCYITALAEDPKDPARPLPVVLKAVDVPPAYTGLSAWPEGNFIGASAGFELARHLDLHEGSDLGISLPPRPGSWLMPRLRIRLLSVFRLDFSEFDQRWIVLPLDRMLDAVPDLKTSGIEIILDDPDIVAETRKSLEQRAPELFFSDWREMNSSLFSALRWQTISLFVVLSLVVAVASFQLSSALIVLSIDKRRSTGMLQAMGATPGRIWRILGMSGFFLGLGGVVFGILLGSVSCWVLNVTRAVRFPEDLARIYLIDHVSFLVSLPGIGAIVGICLSLVLFASLWPAYRSSRMTPAAAIKAV